MTLKRIFIFLLAVGVVFSCGKEPQKESVKIITTNITVPSLIEIEEGQDITLQLRGITNISTDDRIVLRNAAGNDTPCSIVDYKDGSHLSFALPEGFTAGHYKLYIRSGGLNNYAGEFDLSIIQALNVEPEPGVTVYGMVECGGKGVPDVLVSDGAEIVKTDKNGIYQLKSEKKWKYVFVIIPTGYEVPNDGILPRFHQTLSQSATVAERKDFELIKVDNDEFTMLVAGDMHLAKRNDDISQFAGVAKTMNEAINAAKGKTYVWTMGDMTWDLYWYSNSYEFPQYLQTANTYFKDITFFHTMGNHDNDMNSVGDYDKSFKYTRDIAPTYYSFNLGQIHFIVLDNIDYNNVGTGSDARGEYKRNYTAEQMSWLAKDLSFVSKDTPVFISSHAPLSLPNGANSFNNTYMNGADSAGEANMTDFIKAVLGYNVHFLSGHTHNIFNRKHSGVLSEHNQGAVCASWWWSGHLTKGIHVSQDGSPGGFGIWSFKGKDFTQSFQAAGHDIDYQFRAYDMDKVKEVIVPSLGNNHKDFTKYSTAVADYPANTILVNVWDYDQDWKVEILEGETPLSVSKVYTYDPLHIVALSAPRCKSAAATSTPSFLTTSWTHFFQAKASSATSTVTVKVTDRNGKVYTETMTRPKAFDINEYKNK